MDWDADFLMIIAAAAVLCAAVLYLFRHRSSAKTRLDPVIGGLLNLAADQRSTMLVEFEGPETFGAQLSGPLLAVTAHGLLIDVALRGDSPSRWIGESVQVSFKIEGKGASSYYRFVCRVRDMPSRFGAHALLLDNPEEIRSSQRRRFVRIALTGENTFGMGVWLLRPETPRPAVPSALGHALYSYRRDKTEQLALLNISAGGLRMQIRAPEADEAGAMRPGARLICLVMLRSDETEGKTLPFWLDCVITHKLDPEEDAQEAEDEAEGNRRLTFGLSFTAWAVQNRGKGAVDWFTVEEGGAVGPLAAWVLRRQIARYAQLR